MMVLAGIAYICHRNGINPAQALFFLNILGGRRQHHRYGPMGMGGFGRPGMGYGGGMGYGFGRPGHARGRWF